MKCRAYYTYGAGRNLVATSIVIDCRTEPTPEQAVPLVTKALAADGLTWRDIRVTSVEEER